MRRTATAIVLLLCAASARAQDAPPADDRYVFAAQGGHEARVTFDPTPIGASLESPP